MKSFFLFFKAFLLFATFFFNLTQNAVLKERSRNKLEVKISIHWVWQQYRVCFSSPGRRDLRQNLPFFVASFEKHSRTRLAAAMAYFADDPMVPVLPERAFLAIIRESIASDPRNAAPLRETCKSFDQLCCRVLWERFQMVKERYANEWLVKRQNGQGSGDVINGGDVIRGTVCVLWVAVRRFVDSGICPFFMYNALRLAEKRSISSLQPRGYLMRAASYALNHFFRSLQDRTWSNLEAQRRSRPLEAVALLDVLKLCSAVRIHEDSLEEEEGYGGLGRARFACQILGVGVWAYDLSCCPKREPVFLQDLLDFVCFFVAQRNIDLMGASGDEWVVPHAAMYTELHTSSESVLFRVDCDEAFATNVEVDLVCWKGFLLEEESEMSLVDRSEDFCLDISISPAPGTPSSLYRYRVTVDKILRLPP